MKTTTHDDPVTVAPSTATQFAPLAFTLNVPDAQEQAPILLTASSEGFGRELGRVTFNEVTATVLTWTDNTILTSVPYGATTGDLTVRTADGRTAAVPFRVVSGVWKSDLRDT